MSDGALSDAFGSNSMSDRALSDAARKCNDFLLGRDVVETTVSVVAWTCLLEDVGVCSYVAVGTSSCMLLDDLATALNRFGCSICRPTVVALCVMLGTTCGNRSQHA